VLEGLLASVLVGAGSVGCADRGRRSWSRCGRGWVSVACRCPARWCVHGCLRSVGQPSGAAWRGRW